MKSPSMAESLSKLRLSEEKSAPDSCSGSVDSGGGEKDGAGFLSFVKGLLGSVVKLGSPPSAKITTLSEPNKVSEPVWPALVGWREAGPVIGKNSHRFFFEGGNQLYLSEPKLLSQQ